MNNKDTYVAVIDLGSSRILGCLGRILPDGKLRIVASKRILVDTEIRRGVIQNVQEVAEQIQSVLEDFQQHPQYPCQIEKVYVGINAYTIYSVSASSVIHLNESEVINDVLLDTMWEDACEKNKPENKDILYHFVQKYSVDGFQSMDPRGERPFEVEASYKMIVGKPLILKNVEDAFMESGAGDAFRHILGILASSEAVLTPEDKGKGVVVIDFGSDTTAICIYKDNVVRHVAVLPFGGSNITNDLKQLNLEQDEAERLKKQKGMAQYYTEWMAENNIDKEPSEEDKLFNEIVVARIEEIVENIWAQIQYAGVSTAMLPSGIVITGGASRLNGLKKLLMHKTDLPVRDGDVSLHLSEDTAEEFRTPEYAQSIGLMLLGKDGVTVTPVEIKVEEPVKEVIKEQALFEDVPPSEPAQKTKREKAPKPAKSTGGFKESLGRLFNTLEESMNE